MRSGVAAAMLGAAAAAGCAPHTLVSQCGEQKETLAAGARLLHVRPARDWRLTVRLASDSASVCGPASGHVIFAAVDESTKSTASRAYAPLRCVAADGAAVCRMDASAEAVPRLLPQTYAVRLALYTERGGASVTDIGTADWSHAVPERSGAGRALPVDQDDDRFDIVLPELRPTHTHRDPAEGSVPLVALCSVLVLLPWVVLLRHGGIAKRLGAALRHRHTSIVVIIAATWAAASLLTFAFLSAGAVVRLSALLAAPSFAGVYFLQRSHPAQPLPVCDAMTVPHDAS